MSVFKQLGVAHVFDTTFSRDFTLLESAAEFVRRFRDRSPTQPLPLIASACPGWVCYAEKRYGVDIIPHMSTVRSPQQVMGSLVKNYWSSLINVPYV